MKGILLIEDDVPLRESLEALLSLEGFHVTTAGNGKLGIALYLQRPADLILTDLDLPEVNGFDVIRTLLAHAPGAKIIAMTGGSTDAHGDPLNEAMRLGARFAFQKPFSAKKLLAAVAELLAEAEG